MTNPLVSIVIPTYNRAHLLGQAIHSALAQTYAPVEVIVVDDGSTDDTAAVVAGFGDRVRYVAIANGGSSVARNAGLEAARGEFIALLDDDDLLEPGLVAQAVDVLRERPAAGMVYTSFVMVDADNQPLATHHLSAEGRVYRRFLLRCKVSLSGVVLRKETVQRTGTFDPALRMGQDRDYWLRVAKHDEVAVLSEPLVRVRAHASNKPRDPALIHDVFNRIADKHFAPGHKLGRWFERRVYARIEFEAGHYALQYAPDNLALAAAYWRAGVIRWPLDPLGMLLGARLVFRWLVPGGVRRRVGGR